MTFTMAEQQRMDYAKINKEYSQLFDEMQERYMTEMKE